MDTIVKTVLVVAMRKLPITVSLLVNGELTSPVGLDDVAVEIDGVITKQVVVTSVNLIDLLTVHYPTDISLLTAIPGHCDRGLYLLQEGELTIYTRSASTTGLKKVVDKCRNMGCSVELREVLLDLVIDEPTEYDWLEV